MNENEKDLIKKTRELEIQLFDMWYADYEGAKEAKIESPIEKIFYMNFMCLNFMRHSIDGMPVGGFGTSHFLDFQCQQIIDQLTGKNITRDNYIPKKYYIVDFIIEYWRNGPENKLDFKMAVELDGHDFHERTKEQSKNDKERDRILQSHGYFVARYTGSEIYNNPQKVCSNIQDIFCDAMMARIRSSARD